MLDLGLVFSLFVRPPTAALFSHMTFALVTLSHEPTVNLRTFKSLYTRTTDDWLNVQHKSSGSQFPSLGFRVQSV